MKNFPALRIAEKELRDLLRDKRSLLVSLVFPLILFPLIFGSLDSTFSSAGKNNPETMTIAVTSVKENPVLDFLNNQQNIKLVRSSDPVASLKNHEVQAALTISPSEGSNTGITITADNSRQKSLTTAAAVRGIIDAFLQPPGEKSVKSDVLYAARTGESMLTLSIILPLLLLTFTSVSPTAVAADLGAGEKERQTLEPLLANPVSRVNILTGKFLAATAMGLAGVVSFITGFIISYIINPGFLGTDGFEFTIGTAPLLLITVQTILLSMIFSSAELTLSIFAKSTKEAQILFIPLLMSSMACGYSTTLIDIDSGINALFRHIPLVNSGLLIKELSLDSASLFGTAVTLIWSLIYITVFFMLSLAFLKSEKVIFRS